MDIIGFLCVSLDSATVELHDSLGSRRAWACSEAGFISQYDDPAWVYTTEEQRSVVSFYGQEDSMQRIFVNVFCLRWEVFARKAVHSLIEKLPPWRQTFRWWRTGWNGGGEMAETTVKRLLCWEFRRTGKAIGQVYWCWWRVCHEINVFLRFEYHIF
jgi:hypothetical protein